MKKIKICMLAALLVMSVFVLSACSSKKSDTNQSTSPSGTMQSTTAAGSGTNESSTSGTNGTAATEGTGSASGETSERGGRGNEESSTGVLDGMADDVEEGMDDLLNGPGVTSSSSEDR